MHELCRVQELAQSLVSTREHSDDRTRQYSLRGLRLPFIYGSHHRWQNVDEQTSISHKSINTPSSPVLAADEMFDLTTTEDEDDFDIFDYIKIEAVQEEKLDMPNLGASGPTREHDATWKNLDPKVVLLLGSHVCSAILHAIQRTDSHGEPERRTDRLSRSATSTIEQDHSFYIWRRLDQLYEAIDNARRILQHIPIAMP